MTYKLSRYKPEITIKKGAIAGLATTIILVILQFVIDGNIVIESAALGGLLIALARAAENYVKNKD
jgi:hypothetical protein